MKYVNAVRHPLLSAPCNRKFRSSEASRCQNDACDNCGISLDERADQVVNPVTGNFDNMCYIGSRDNSETTHINDPINGASLAGQFAECAQNVEKVLTHVAGDRVKMSVKCPRGSSIFAIDKSKLHDKPEYILGPGPPQVMSPEPSQQKLGSSASPHLPWALAHSRGEGLIFALRSVSDLPPHRNCPHCSSQRGDFPRGRRTSSDSSSTASSGTMTATPSAAGSVSPTRTTSLWTTKLGARGPFWQQSCTRGRRQKPGSSPSLGPYSLRINSPASSTGEGMCRNRLSAHAISSQPTPAPAGRPAHVHHFGLRAHPIATKKSLTNSASVCLVATWAGSRLQRRTPARPSR